MLTLIHALARFAREEIRTRRDWLRVYAECTKNSSRLGWHARCVGKLISIGSQSVVEDFACLHTGMMDEKSEHIRIGSGTVIRPYAQIYTWGGCVDIGDYCSVNSFTTLYATGGIKIGDSVRIAAHTVIVASSHRFDSTERPIREQGYTALGITIEDDVWIGAGCHILDGIRIGRGSVIAANSVVREDVPPYEIIAGAPAKTVRNRLDRSVVPTFSDGWQSRGANP
jgi:acetyltransferase-like isoleucine patch superfamily enzyme